MDKKKIQIIIIGILALVFIAALLNSLIKIKGKTSARPGPAVPTEEKTPERMMTGLKKEGKIKDLPWGRDPFVLQEESAAEAGTVGGLKLMGITTGANIKSMAIINNEIVVVGSRLGNFTILKITRDRVLLTDGKENYELQMKLQ